MRANEFVVEGPVDKFGDMLQKQVIGAKQQKQAKAKKQNVPKIAKLLQQNLSAKAKQVGSDPDAISKMAFAALSKALKINTKTREELADAIDPIVDALIANPESFETDPSAFESISSLVTASLETQADEEEPEEKSKDAVDDHVQDVKDAIKDALLEDPEEIMKRDPDDLREYIVRQLARNDIKDSDVTEITNELMNDRDMPWNYQPNENFRGLVYSPGGTRHVKNEAEKNVAFVKNEGRWSQWVIGPSSIWKYAEPVTDKSQTGQLDVLAKQATGDVVPMNFRIDQTEGAGGVFRVSSR